MKFSILKSVLLFSAALALQSCNSKSGNIESDIENPATSQENGSPAGGGTAGGDTLQNNDQSRNDAMRMSDGKDSVDGEVTPPNAKEQ
ncbi:MAG TPA: hypothetical protein VFR70_04825 [Flavobacterium sp.]|nr:hypothetical protein [Flavobacterium sp.]